MIKTTSFLKLIGFFTLFSGVIGCSTAPYHAEPPITDYLDALGPTKQCANVLIKFNTYVAEEHVSEPGLAAIPGFPYLRVNRFLASFGPELRDVQAFSAWVKEMRKLDQKARTLEFARLPAESQASLNSMADNNALAYVDDCAAKLMQQDLVTLHNRERLAKRAYIEDEYVDVNRWLGIYAVTKYFVKFGSDGWLEEASDAYKKSLTEPQDEHTFYRPQIRNSKVKVDSALEDLQLSAAQHPLGIPDISAASFDALAAKYAPIWELEIKSDADRMGAIQAGEDSWLVDHDSPTVYTTRSYTRFAGKVYLQINYINWFSERPPSGWLNLYGGELDGLVWRVTLNERGEPLIFDSIHNCGCYHYVFPSPKLVLDVNTDDENPLIINEPNLFNAAGDLFIKLSANDHQIRRVYKTTSKGLVEESYDIKPYDHLKQLEDPAGDIVSMFDQDGLVPHTSRRESLLLWPTGVKDAGAMRAMGTHATAFVGKRHFDDAFLFKNWFKFVFE